MAIACAVDFRAAFEDVLAIAQSARAPTSGWRAICVRERRRLGAALVNPLSELDLDDDIATLGEAVRDLARSAAHDVDMLVFGLFDAIDDGAGGYAGYHVAGVASRRRKVADVMLDPWTPERRFLRSTTLDAIVRVARRAPPEARSLLEYSLCFGAAALTSRFVTAGLDHRVVVAFDEERSRCAPVGAPTFAEVRGVSSQATATSLGSALPRLLQMC